MEGDPAADLIWPQNELLRGKILISGMERSASTTRRSSPDAIFQVFLHLVAVGNTPGTAGESGRPTCSKER